MSLNRKSELLEYLSSNGKVYELKVENINVQMNYANNGKKIDECMLNILKRKIGK